MSHEIHWMKPGRVLYINYIGHQTPETLKACLDDMADELDKVTFPVMMVINWKEVTSAEPNVLQSQLGHRSYNHPMAARAILVGFDIVEKYQNETAAATTRGGSS